MTIQMMMKKAKVNSDLQISLADLGDLDKDSKEEKPAEMKKEEPKKAEEPKKEEPKKEEPKKEEAPVKIETAPAAPVAPAAQKEEPKKA